ncbi:MAG: AbrB/MazE/SpoVT family DNA-binding domain-containing protein [Sporomusaceae bacterium]|jgi:bifunctional DNA-binding transcriptional regulator/antitoxin component of YhaV-PrlF toxin-antitoxin module|nr:AbrB/MazE/SpoVT family DNA-binding domain-containing protein [Sporomusaceae bacterium]
MNTVTKETAPIVKKRISVSSKRQITIPIDFFNKVGIETEVECYVQAGAIVIRPVQDSGGEFAEQILADLISQGYSGQELLAKFKAASRQIRPAVEKLLAEASLIAKEKTPYETIEDIFGGEDNDN